MAMLETELPAPASSGCFLVSAEAPLPGHPDQVVVQVLEAIVDACLREDPASLVSCEAVAKTGFIMVLGDATTRAKVDCDAVVRNTVKNLGYDSADKGLDYKLMEVVNKVEIRAPDRDVPAGLGGHDPSTSQGVFHGYATNETPELIPLATLLVATLSAKLTELRRSAASTWLLPDGKVQVVVECRKDADGAVVPVRIHTVTICVQHLPDASPNRVRQEIQEVVHDALPLSLVDSSTIVRINAAERFAIGGPHRSAGLTGCQAVVDSFGSFAVWVAGPGVGKDPHKVQRAAPYQARRAAKSLVSSGLAARCTVQVAYIGGNDVPALLSVDSHGSARQGLSDAQLAEIVRRHFDFRPGAIAEDLGLQSVRYSSLTAQNFGAKGLQPEWERAKDLSVATAGG